MKNRGSSHATVTDDTALTDTLAPCFELWFDQENPVCTFVSEVGELSTHHSQRDEREIRNDDVERCAELLGICCADIRTFYDFHSIISSDAPMHLPISNIYSRHRASPSLEKAIRESSCGCSDVDHSCGMDVDAERFESRVQFATGPAHEWLRVGGEMDRIFGGNKRGWLRRSVRADSDKAGLDCASRLGSTLDKLAPNELSVESSTGQGDDSGRCPSALVVRSSSR